jgi:hypothetical protein
MISAETPVALVFPVDMFGAKISLRHFLQWNAHCRSLQDADDLFEEGVIEDPQNSALCQICQQVSVCLGSQTCGVFSMISTYLYVPLVRKHTVQYHLVAVCRGSPSKVEWLVEFPVARTGWKRYFTFSTGSSTWTHTRGRGNCKTISVLFCS